jgi:hypothetical protein
MAATKAIASPAEVKRLFTTMAHCAGTSIFTLETTQAFVPKEPIPIAADGYTSPSFSGVLPSGPVAHPA